MACDLLWMTTVSDAQATADGNFYVSPTGSDSNSGLLSTPWQTITHAVLSTHVGDTIFFSGNYISGTTGPSLYIHDESLSVYPAGAAVSGYNNVVIAGNVIKGSMSSGLVLSTGSNFAVQNS